MAADQNRGRVSNIMHVGAPTTARAARMAERAARAGVEAICCVPPFFYRFTDDEIVKHYKVVAAAADLPLFVYNLPQSTGVEITPDLMRKIRDAVPQLAGLKHSSYDFAATRAYVAMGLSCLIGGGQTMLPALTLGASGCVDGPPCVVPELFVRIWSAYVDGDLKAAEAAQAEASRIYPVLLRFGYLASLKALVSERLGVDCGNPRPPTLPLTAEQRAWVIEEAARVGVSRAAVEEATA